MTVIIIPLSCFRDVHNGIIYGLHEYHNGVIVIRTMPLRPFCRDIIMAPQ